MYLKHVGSIIVAVLGLTLLSGLGSNPPEAPKDLQSVQLFQNADLAGIDAEEAEARFRESRTPLGFSELLDYAMTQMLQDRFREAAVLYELAALQAGDDSQRAMAHMFEGQALLEVAYAEEAAEAQRLFQRAGGVFNKASRIAPESQEAVIMRLVAWTCAGDQLETMAAEQDQRRLGLALEGQEVALGVLASAAIEVVRNPSARRAAGRVIFKLLDHAGAIMYLIELKISDLSSEEKLDRLRTMAFLSFFTSFRASRVPNKTFR